MISDVITLIDFLSKHKRDYQTKSALFSYDGTKINGDNLIEVQKIPTNDVRIWFYKIKEVTNFEFIYMPVIPSLYIDYGQFEGDTNPNAKIFRFVGNPLAKFSSGGEPNVKANFIVVAYKPSDLLVLRES